MLLEQYQLEPERVADQLPGILDQEFMVAIGWDADQLLLQPPSDHPLLGWAQCIVPECLVDAATYGGLCTGCKKRLAHSDMTREAFIADPPPKTGGGTYKWLIDEWVCQVNGCPRPISSRQTDLCGSHAGGCRAVFGHVTAETIARYLQLPTTVALAPLGGCKVATCLRLTHFNGGLCRIHAVRWREDVKAEPRRDFEHWCRVEPGVALSGVANLRGLEASVVTELLAGIQLRAQQELRTRYTYLNTIANDLRCQQVSTIFELDPPPRQRAVANVRLLADRERVLAATELTDWARAEATPSEEEITASTQLARPIEN
ncbi:hypothetical protein ACQP2T_56250 [Nonomuraea sp. CA-143628]|uniref:hypothetical protein n=1 Tax=Nonomuraea sp. CA-143628 TaxID=3239997 RepID=UPI003D8B368C